MSTLVWNEEFQFVILKRSPSSKVGFDSSDGGTERVFYPSYSSYRALNRTCSGLELVFFCSEWRETAFLAGDGGFGVGGDRQGVDVFD